MKDEEKPTMVLEPSEADIDRVIDFLYQNSNISAGIGALIVLGCPEEIAAFRNGLKAAMPRYTLTYTMAGVGGGTDHERGMGA